MPVTLRYGLPLALVGVLVAAFWPQIRELARSLLPAYARLKVMDQQGQLLPRVRLQVFPYDVTAFGPSPTELLSDREVEVDESGIIELGEEHMPQEALVRITAPGYGADYRHLTRGGRRVPEVRLGEPMHVSGTVRSVSGEPLPRARVLALGGDRRGVLLGEARSDQAGAFTIRDLSKGVSVMVVRVLHRGYGLAEKTWWQQPTHREPNEEEKQKASLDFELRPVPPAKGRVLLPEGVTADDLEIRVYQFPGVSAKVAEDGSFSLHHLAKAGASVFRILVANLPEQFTHPRVRVRPGDSGVKVPVRAAVMVTGRVVSEDSGRPMPGAMVSHENGPRGRRKAEASADGRFKLAGVPAGDVEFTITLRKSRRHPNGGVRMKRVHIEAGAEQKPVILRVW